MNVDWDWNIFFHVINTTDTVLGVVFLATSWLVARRWWRSHHAQEEREHLGTPRAEEAPSDDDAW